MRYTKDALKDTRPDRQIDAFRFSNGGGEEGATCIYDDTASPANNPADNTLSINC